MLHGTKLCSTHYFRDSMLYFLASHTLFTHVNSYMPLHYLFGLFLFHVGLDLYKSFVSSQSLWTYFTFFSPHAHIILVWVLPSLTLFNVVFPLITTPSFNNLFLFIFFLIFIWFHLCDFSCLRGLSSINSMQSFLIMESLIEL